MMQNIHVMQLIIEFSLDAEVPDHHTHGIFVLNESRIELFMQKRVAYSPIGINKWLILGPNRNR